MIKEFWDKRFEADEFIYSENPNQFVKSFVENAPKTGKILFTAEGEGRNAVFAARNDWTVFACDFSESGQKKALRLAAKNNVSIDYQLLDLNDILTHYPMESFDVIAVVFNHFPPEMRQKFHASLPSLLKKGGKIIMEVFNKRQLPKTSGGPKREDMLYSKALLVADFADMTMEYLEETKIILNEGAFHQGEAEVVRMIAVK